MGNTENLHGKEAVAKLRELAQDVGICMFCTDLGNMPFSTRPMSLQDVDDNGGLWFISGDDSHKNQEIRQDDKVQLIFSKSSNAHFLSVYGTASIYRDRSKVEEMWSPIAKTWFKEGKDDPDVTVICVSPLESYYWDTQDGKIVSMIKIITSAVTGAQRDGGVEGSLNV